MHLWSAVTGWINWHSDHHHGSGIGPYQDMDTISMLLTGWVVFIILSVGIVKYLYYRFVKKTNFMDYEEVDGDEEEEDDHQETTTAKRNGPSLSTRIVETITGVTSRPTAPVRRKRLDRKQESKEDQGPCATGPDPKVVDFINQIYDWALKPGSKGVRPWPEIKSTFTTVINRLLKEDSSDGDGIVVSDLSLKEDPRLFNIFAECTHPDNVKVTADCTLQLKGTVTLTKKEGKQETTHSFFVDKLSGRWSALLNCEDKTALLKLDGWPDISVGVEGTSSTGDAIASAIRNTVVELNWGGYEYFPLPGKKFLPDKRYLLITLVRGRDLGEKKGCQEAFCAIELDDPPQKFQTDAVKSTNPVWNENFVLTIVPTGGELLFEVCDKIGARFLGCNIVSVEEITGGTVETLKLKSRKMEESELFSGSIDVQFTLLTEGEYILRSKEKSLAPSKGVAVTTRSVFTRSSEQQAGSTSSAAFAENVIKEFGRKALPNAEKSTLIIYAVQRDRPASADSAIHVDGSGDEDRGRKRTKKGDIFSSLKRRFSKGRSHSVVAGEKVDDQTTGETSLSPTTSGVPRSVSADRQGASSTFRGIGSSSARSSTSELSGISSFSTTTFVHENSTLVIESVENRIKKYFLVPPNLAESGSYKKRGKKLHIYNDHTFTAKHQPGGTLCEICTLRLPFSIGKQGYVCRDCGMKCHKECHVRAPSFCPKTTIYDIELSTLKIEPTKGGNKGPLLGGNKVGAASEEKKKKKKSNIFRRVTRLGKISEENLEEKENEAGEGETPEKNEQEATTEEAAGCSKPEEEIKKEQDDKKEASDPTTKKIEEKSEQEPKK